MKNNPPLDEGLKHRRSFVIDESSSLALSEFINAKIYSSFNALMRDVVHVFFGVLVENLDFFGTNPFNLDKAHKALMKKIIEDRKGDKRE